MQRGRQGSGGGKRIEEGQGTGQRGAMGKAVLEWGWVWGPRVCAQNVPRTLSLVKFDFYPEEFSVGRLFRSWVTNPPPSNSPIDDFYPEEFSVGWLFHSWVTNPPASNSPIEAQPWQWRSIN